MLIVRFVLIILFIPAFIVIARSLGSRSKALRSLLLFSFPALIGFSILFPGTWQSMADFLGLERGADLLLYVTVLTLVTYIGYSFGKFRHLEKRIATLAQELALLRAADENPQI